jgi:tRNA1(Val) A37 N6-methylase TrmN6
VNTLPRDEAIDETGFLGGQVKLRQLRRGHRAGTDAALVVAAARPYAKGRIADLGSGGGAIGVSLAQLEPALEAVLIEIDPLLARLASEAAAANGCASHLRVVEADVRLLEKRENTPPDLAASCDLVVTNPPFTNARNQRASPDRLRAKAHLMREDELRAWIGAACALLKPRGRLVLIHRPDSLAALLDALKPAFGAIAIRPVHPRAGDAAIRILLLARKGARAPLAIVPPLILHEADGAFTPLAAAIHRGEAELRFDQ